MHGDALRRVLARLPDHRQAGGQYTAHCPAHDDARASLSIRQGDEGAVINCFAGCPSRAVVDALGLTISDLFDEPRVARSTPAPSPVTSREVAWYDYTDEQDSVLYQVVRREPKDFRQRRLGERGEWVWRLDDVRRVLYRLPHVIAGVMANRVVFIVEGEKDANALAELGLIATTVAGGAHAPWLDEYTEVLRGARVAILPDNDRPGREHAAKVARALLPVAADVRIIALPGLPEKGDVSDWLAAGRTLDALLALYDATSSTTAAELGALEASDARSQEDERTRGGRPAPIPLRVLLARPELLTPPPAVIPHLAYRARVTLLSAREKTGKSTLLGQAAAALSAGAGFLDDHLGAAHVLWYALDEPLSDAVRRLQQYGADPDRISIQTERPSPDDLGAEIRAVGADVVIVDTLTELWAEVVRSDRDAQEVARFLGPYVRVAREAGAALVFSHHTTKDGVEYRGSVQLGAAVDIVLTLDQPSRRRAGDPHAGDEDAGEDDGRRTLRGKGRGVAVDLRLSYDGTRYTMGEAPRSLRLRVLHALAQGEASGSVLAEKLRVRKQTVLDELNGLRDEGLVLRVAGAHRLSPHGELAVRAPIPILGSQSSASDASGTGAGTGPQSPHLQLGNAGTAPEPERNWSEPAAGTEHVQTGSQFPAYTPEPGTDGAIDGAQAPAAVPGAWDDGDDEGEWI